MKKIFYFLCCLVILVLNCPKSSAQTSIITYIRDPNMVSQNNLYPLNVFTSGSGVNVTPSNLTNYSWAGGVTYTQATGIQLSVINPPQPQQLAGTAYYIKYNFLPGSTYTITIAALANIANVSPQTFSLNTSVVSVPQQFNRNIQITSGQDADVISYSLQGFGFKRFYPTLTSATYTVPDFIPTVGSNLGTLMIWAAGSIGNLSIANITISTITIKQVTPTFTLAASSSSYACGSTSPISFTYTNVYSSPNVTGYTWNLGVNNGWSYNGSTTSAPATITTAAPTLTLTPICGMTQSPVSATVTSSNFQYATNVLTIPVIQPVMSIIGSPSICLGSSTYSIANLPSCGTTVVWSVSPTSIVTPNNNNGATISLSQITNGIVTLTATFTGSCAPAPITKTLTSGTPLLYINSTPGACSGPYQT